MQYEPAYYIGKYRARIFAAVLATLIVSVSLAIYHHVQTQEARRGKIAVPVEVVPRDATVTIPGETDLPSRGDIYLKPGDYKVTVKKPGFETQTRTVRVSREGSPYVYVGLAGASKSAKKWVTQHTREYQRLEYLTTEKSREFGAKFKANNPIIADLPINDPYYSVSYRNRDDATVELIIWGTSPATRMAALNLLRDKGHEPTDYHITYDGFKNPLETR